MRNNFIKNFKAFDYITSGPLTYGIGVSSIYIPVNEMIEYFTIEKVIAEMSRLQEKKNLALFIVITKYEQGPKKELTKEMMLFSDNEYLDENESEYPDLKKALMACTNKKLSNQKEYFTEERSRYRLTTWKQDGITRDRKTLDKFLKKFYKFGQAPKKEEPKKVEPKAEDSKDN